MQKLMFYDDSLSSIEVQFTSDVQINKVIEMFTTGIIKDLLIYQPGGWFRIKQIARGIRTVLVELSDHKDPTKPNTVGLINKHRMELSPSYIIGKICDEINFTDQDLYTNDIGEMTWVDMFGTHIMVDNGNVINIYDDGRIDYDAYVNSHSVIGNVHTKEYNCMATPTIYDNQLDYLIKYDPNHKVMSRAVHSTSECSSTLTDIDTEIRYLVDNDGKLLIAYEIDGRHTTDLMADAYIVQKHIGETLYKLGSADDLNGHVILLHDVHGGKPYAEYKSYEEFAKEWQQMKNEEK